jgi:AcrR family transcriptional regulator
MQRHGPADITLAHIAAEAGLTAGALVQRFGSKRALLLRLMEGAAGGTRAMLVGMRGRRSALSALYYYAECFAQMGEAPGGLEHNLAWLQLDIGDPDFNRFARAQAQETSAVLEQWIAEAVADGDLHADTDAAALARVLQATVGGSLIAWGFYRKGRPAAWVRTDLELLLRPYGTAP